MISMLQLPVLVVAPHADDAEVHAGGLIRRVSCLGGKASVLVLSAHPACGTREEAERALRTLSAGCPETPDLLWDGRFPDVLFREHARDVKMAIREAIRETGARTLVCPAGGDRHEDHREVLDACRTLSADAPRTLLGYISANRGTLPAPTLYLSLSEEDVRVKAEAVGIYSAAAGKHWALPETIRAHAVHYGCSSRTGFAEAYVVERICL